MAKKSPKQSENAAARAATEAYASPFSTAFGGTAPSTELDAARQYASPFSTAFGGTAPTTELEAAREYASPFSTAFGGTAPTFAADIPAASGAGAGAGAGAGSGANKTTGPSGQMQDAYQRLFDEFNVLGLGALVTEAKDLIMKATSIAGMPDALRASKVYKDRFSANDARIKAGLTALSPAEYLNMEDKYQEVMRMYGLPASYYTPGLYGKQEGFDKLLANDISNTELEDRISTAQQRVLNANPEVLSALKSFYPEITNGEILAYTLDPTKAITDIKKKVTAAEIQGAANVFGLNKITAESTPAQIQALEARANALAGYGVDKAAAQQGFETVSDLVPRGSQLADIYGQDPYTQATAESEVFKTSGAAVAKEKRKKLTALEQAQFGGSSGVGALGRDRGNGAFGAGSY
jgi:hypothetical protein